MSASRNLEIALKNGKGASDVKDFETMKKNQDVLTSFPDTYRTTDRYYLEDAAITVTSPSLGSQVQFEVKDTDMMVGNFMLDIKIAVSATTACAEGWVANLLNRIEVRLGGNRLTWMSGQALAYNLLVENTSRSDKQRIMEMFGSVSGTGSGSVADGSRFCVPLICPGSKGLINNPMNIDQKPLFPVGMAGQSLMFYITLEGTAGNIEPNGKITVSSMVLRYNRARVKDKAFIPTPTSGLKKAIYSFVFPYVQEDVYAITDAATNASVNQDIKSVITQGELQHLIVVKSTAAKYDIGSGVGSGRFDGGEVKSFTLSVEGNPTYSVSSTQEYRLKNLMLNKSTALLPKGDGTDGGGYFYVIPISPNYTYDLFNLGAPGINFNQSNMILTTESIVNGTAVKLFVCAVYKAVIHIYDNKSAEIKYDMSNPY